MNFKEMLPLCTLLCSSVNILFVSFIHVVLYSHSSSTCCVIHSIVWILLPLFTILLWMNIWVSSFWLLWMKATLGIRIDIFLWHVFISLGWLSRSRFLGNKIDVCLISWEISSYFSPSTFQPCHLSPLSKTAVTQMLDLLLLQVTETAPCFFPSWFIFCFPD